MSARPEIDTTPPTWGESLPRLAVKLVVLIAIVFLSHFVIDFALSWAESLPARAEARAERLILLGIFITYALLIALPFVPGIEIAIALLVLRGPEFALPIYLATMGGLSLAFLAGRLVPIHSLSSASSSTCIWSRPQAWWTGSVPWARRSACESSNAACRASMRVLRCAIATWDSRF